MGRAFKKTVEILFYILFFLVPLVLFPKTSEIFEFNKVTIIYLLTVLISATWISRMIIEKKVIFRRSILDVPLLLFLASQFLSFLVSIDKRTSLLGYYSRFHGGLISLTSYALLYWAYVSNMDRIKTLKALRVILYAGILVSLYGVAEHFGIDKDIWVQDVQNRVFSTLGQPNWLAAWAVSLLPITWAFALNSKSQILNPKLKRPWIWIALSALFFLTFLYTKSRSGLLGFSAAYITFWAGAMWIRKKNLITLRSSFLVISSSLLVITSLVGTPWTPGLGKLFSHQSPVTSPQPLSFGPALETGGTESGEIRKIVWKGAIEIWKHYPILGSGVETFAFSYYRFRPVEHNLTSEWDYLYNKAHNEYLNFLATTGIVGLAAYLFLIATIGFVFFKNSHLNSNLKINKVEKSLEIGKWSLIILALAAGWASILVTNFFGFSVVPVALLFFLYPAMAVTLVTSDKVQATSYRKIVTSQKLAIGFFLLLTSYFLLLIGRYWYSDFLYAQGKVENDSANFVKARPYLSKSIKLFPSEAIFWDELSQADAGVAVALQEESNPDAENFANLALSESETAISLSPANVNLKRSRAGLFVKLSTISPDYLVEAKETLEDSINLAPTDAKLLYNLTLAYVRIGERDKAIEGLVKTTQMKPNYRDARFALALLYIDAGAPDRAKEELEYILTKINPQDATVQKELEELTK